MLGGWWAGKGWKRV